MMENKLFYTEKITDHITRIVMPGQVFGYLVVGSERAVLIDTGCGIGDLRSFVEQLTDKPVTVLLTHGHLDHAPGAVQFDEVYMCVLDNEMVGIHSVPERRFGFAAGTDGEENIRYTMDDVLPADDPSRYHDLCDGDVFLLGDYAVEVFSCPGHTQGSKCFLLCEDRILLTGDACNPFTFLFGPAAKGLKSYEESLERLLQSASGRYDRILVSHGIGEIASRTMIEENLQVIRDIRSGNVVNTPFGFGASKGLFIAKEHPRLNEYGEVMANIVYDPARIEE